jgi:NAD(P)-dependent dehydrogenase (short-subunit alcohol dehydrogenase family)
MNKDIFDLSEKIVILTGGLGLIGLNYVKALTQKGATVNVLDIKNNKEARQILAAGISDDLSANVFYYQADITDKPALEKVRAGIMRKFGRIDVLINNAALIPKVEADKKLRSCGTIFEELELDSWNNEIEVNLTGSMLCCQVFGKRMKSGSSIINISSIYGLTAPDQSIYEKGFIKPATYGVTKAGIINLTKYLAAYWGKGGIRVNCLALGGVFAGQNKKFLNKYAARTPLGRMARADEFNGIIVYLSSDASTYATGAVFAIDGGWTAW